MPPENDKKHWWETLPGILTGIAAIITAVAGLLAIMGKIGGPTRIVPAAVTATAVTPQEHVPNVPVTPPPSPGTQVSDQKKISGETVVPTVRITNFPHAGDLTADDKGMISGRVEGLSNPQRYKVVVYAHANM